VSDGARVVIFCFFSIHEVVRLVNANKIGNLAQHPKSSGTATVGLQ